jgi:exosortase/archaeosortase family protein
MSRSKFSSAATYLKSNSNYVKILLIFLSVGIPLALLYYVNAESFSHTYNGRSYYLFFLWLLVLEFFAFDWNKYGSKASNIHTKNTAVFGITLALPTVYVLVSNFLGLNAAIIQLGRLQGIGSLWLGEERLLDLPLATEFLVFAMLFGAIILLAYRLKGLADFLPPIALLGGVGIINLITILYPIFTPFQILTPATTTLSADVLNLMGYRTMVIVNSTSYVPTLLLANSQRMWTVSVGWPCAGVDSLIIYTVVILLFLRKANFSWIQGTIYFAVGAGVTYFINVLRVVTIALIGLNGGDLRPFHNYYGQLYSAVWIVSYMLIIIGTRSLWIKLNARKSKENKTIQQALPT